MVNHPFGKFNSFEWLRLNFFYIIKGKECGSEVAGKIDCIFLQIKFSAFPHKSETPKNRSERKNICQVYFWMVMRIKKVVKN